MLAVRHYPELVTPALWVWARGFVSYDADGRCSRWLVEEAGRPLPILLANVARAITPRLDFSVLLQGYQDGLAITPCHTDPPAFGFILSLGALRRFRVHPISDACYDQRNAMTVECVEGTVLVMDEEFHRGWHHQIIPDHGVTAEKLSLVFRTRPGGSG